MSNLAEIILSHPPPFLGDFLEANRHILEGITNYLEGEDEQASLGRGNRVTPRKEEVFSGLQLVSFDKECMFDNSLKVIIVLQDPYPQPGVACGIAMATRNGTVQNSLQNFYKRAVETYSAKVPNQNTDADGKLLPIKTGDIRGLCAQGVLLMNAAMTTRETEKKVHATAWSLYTAQFLKWVSTEFPFLVFVFLGADARSNIRHISDQGKHTIISTSHPSGLGYHAGFHECDLFNEVNASLREHHRPEIRWEDYNYV